MANTKLSNGKADDSVTKALADVTATVQAWTDAIAQDKNGDDATAAVAQARLRLGEKVWRLYSAVKGPADMIHDHLEKV